MRKLSDYKDEEALDLLAEIIEPAVEIFGDKDFANAMQSGNSLSAAKICIKNHKQSILQILATLEGVPVEEYHCNFLTLPMRIIEVLNDENLMALFTSQVQEMKP